MNCRAALALAISFVFLLAQAATADHELVFKVKTYKETLGQPAGSLNSTSTKSKASTEKPAIEHLTTSQSIVLGPDYFVTESGELKTIYDFAKMLKVDLSATNKTYKTSNLHANACFRVLECQNRKFMQVMERTVFPDLPDDFDIESLFGINQPGSQKKLEAKIKKNGKTISFLYDRKRKAVFIPSKSSIDESLKKTYERMLIQVMKIHPSIRKYLAEHNVPSKLEFNYRNDIIEKGTITYELNECKQVPAADLKIPSNYTVYHPTELIGIYKALEKQGGKLTLDPREKVVSAVDAAVKENNYLDAYLNLIEYMLSSGDPMTSEIRKIRDGIKHDADCQKYFSYYGMEKADKDQLKSSIARIESIDRSKLSKGYVIDIELGNAYESLGDLQKAKDLLSSVLEHNPLITGVYHDLGIVYTKEYRMETAWECFDIGQSICPNTGQMRELRQMEQKLEDEFPELF